MLRIPAALLTSLLVTGCATVPAAERGIVVTGTGRVMARPDTGIIDVGVESMAGPVEPGQLEVSVSVEARYAIEP
jgi:uncharacterized protein YggE